MLFLGAKQGKSLFFIPWLTEQIIALSAGIIHGLIMAMGGFLMDIKVLEIILVMVIFVISSFMIYSVLSHFFILRKMKQHSQDIINSVMTGEEILYINYTYELPNIVKSLLELWVTTFLPD